MLSIRAMEKCCEEAKSKAGGPAALARALEERGEKITSQAVSQWKLIPPDKVLNVEAITGISRHDLRPDIFGLKPVDAAATNNEVAQ